MAFTAKKTTLIPYRPISLFQFNKTCLNIFYKIISIEITPLHCNTLVAKLKYGAIHKGCPHIREREREGADKSGQIKKGEEGWLAKCGRPLGKKIIATIFVKFTQIIWQYVCISCHTCVSCYVMPMPCLCVTFTSWSTPSFGMLLSKLSNRNTHVCTSSIRMISSLYPSV